MEALQSLARSTFQEEQECKPSNADFDIIEISALPTETTFHVVTPIIRQESELMTRLISKGSSNETAPANATLTLVSIPRLSGDPSIPVSKQCLPDIFTIFKINDSILYLIARHCFGFHYFEATETSTKTALSSFFLGTTLFGLAWSINPEDMSTNALILFYHQPYFREFLEILRPYKDYINTPVILPLVSSIHLGRYLDARLYDELDIIRDIEIGTGHGAWSSLQPKRSFGDHEITRLSKKTGFSLTRLVNLTRHQKIAFSLLSFWSTDGSKDWYQSFKRHDLEKCERSMKHLVPVASVIKRQIAQSQITINYLIERAKTQFSVVSIHYPRLLCFGSSF
jgi:hypothetical protein